MATAFTSGERAKIRLYLGWSARFHQGDSRLEQAMNAIDSEPDDSTHDLITGILTSIGEIQTAIQGALGRIKALKVGSIDLPGPMEIGMLRSEGTRFVGQLGATLGVEVRHNFFRASPTRGFASWDGPTSGSGNEIKHG